MFVMLLVLSVLVYLGEVVYFDGGVVVVSIAVVATGGVGAPDLFAQVAAIGVAEEGVHRRAGVGDRKLALVPLLLGRSGGGVLDGLRQASEVSALQIQDVAVLIGLEVLAELGKQRGKALVDVGDPGLGF